MVENRPDRVLGQSNDTFWNWCERGELRVQKCVDCEELCWPVVEACEACGGSTFEWQPMSGAGKVVSWCTFEKDYYAGAFPIPWTNILVELAEGPWFMSEPGNFTVDEIEAGMPVRLAFRRCADGRGEFNLPIFTRP